jgi:hypothetical protein
MNRLYIYSIALGIVMTLIAVRVVIYLSTGA